MAGKGRGVGIGKLLGRLRDWLSALPLVKRFFPPPPPAEPFSIIEDSHDTGGEFLKPNAAPSQARPRRIDFSALVEGLRNRPLIIAGLAACVLVLLLILAAGLFVSAPPRALAPAAPSTEEGEKLAEKLILPPDPVLELQPELEAEPRSVYTDEDVSRLRPAPREIDFSDLAARNARDAEALFGTVP